MSDQNNPEYLVSKVVDSLFSFYLEAKKKEVKLLAGLLKLVAYRKMVLNANIKMFRNYKVLYYKPLEEFISATEGESSTPSLPLTGRASSQEKRKATIETWWNQDYTHAFIDSLLLAARVISIVMSKSFVQIAKHFHNPNIKKCTIDTERDIDRFLKTNVKLINSCVESTLQKAWAKQE